MTFYSIIARLARLVVNKLASTEDQIAMYSENDVIITKVG